MARVNFTGFESGNTAECYSVVNGSGGVQSSVARNGTYSWRSLTNGATSYFTVSAIDTDGQMTYADVATSYVRFYIRVASLPGTNGEDIFTCERNPSGFGDPIKFFLFINSDGKIEAFDALESSLGTSSTVLSLNTWYRIELKISTAPGGGGDWEVKIDGTVELSGTDDLTNVNAGLYRFGMTNVSYDGEYDIYFDDIAIDDAEYPGPGQVSILKPNADGHYTDWTANGAANKYECVNEVPYDESTTYIKTSTNSTDYTAALESASGITGAIRSVKGMGVLKMDAAFGTTAYIRMRSGSTDSNNGSSASLVVDYTGYYRILDEDPNTSAAWTVSGLNGLEVGVTCTLKGTGGGSPGPRCTALYAMVDHDTDSANYDASGKLGAVTGVASVSMSFLFGVSGKICIVAGVGGTTVSCLVPMAGTIRSSGVATTSSTLVRIVNICGFETGDATYECYSVAPIFASVQQLATRVGAYALRANPATTSANGWVVISGINNAGEMTTTAANVVTSFTRFYLRIATAPTSNNECIFQVQNSSSSVKLEARLSSNREIKLYDSGLSLLGTSSALSLDTWYRIEIKCGTGASASYELKINGSSSLSGTADLLTDNANLWAFGKYSNRNTQSFDVYFDDIAIYGHDYPGSGDVRVMVPNADGTTANWTPTGDSNRWDCLNDISSDGDSTYISSTSANEIYDANLESCASAGISGDVNAIKVIAISKYTGTDPGASPIEVRVKSGASVVQTDVGFSENGGPTSYRAYSLICYEDPAGGNWSTSDLDSLQVGVSNENTVGTTRVTSLYSMVAYVPSAFTCEATGKISFNGIQLNVVTVLFDSSSGKLLFTGLTSQVGVFVYDTAGQFGLSGQSVLASTVSYLALGKLTSTGQSTFALVVNYFALGQLAYNGLSTPTSTGIYFGSGKLTYAGLATPALSVNYLALGLLSWSGIVSCAATYQYRPIGLLYLTGTLASSNAFSYMPNGKMFVSRGVRFLAYYSLDNQYSPSLDYSDYKNHGTWNGSVTFVSDFPTSSFVNSGSIDLDGNSDEYVNVGTSTILQFTATQSFSVSAWVKVDPTVGGSRAIFTYSGSGSQGWFLKFDESGVGTDCLYFDYHDGTNYHRVQSSNNVSRNVWVHVCYTHDGSNTLTGRKLYVNGTEDSNRSNSGTPSDINYTGRVLQIGAANGSLNWFGLIDEIRVFDRELTPSEVKGLSLGDNLGSMTFVTTAGYPYLTSGKLNIQGVSGFLGGLSISYQANGYLTFRDPTLVLWLKLDEGTGSTAFDSSLYKHDGTLVAMESGDWVTGNPAIRYGSPYALSFDGTNEYIVVPATGLTNQNYTIVLWINPTSLPGSP